MCNSSDGGGGGGGGSIGGCGSDGSGDYRCNSSVVVVLVIVAEFDGFTIMQIH